MDGNDEQVLGTTVVSAVHDGTDGQSQRQAELGSGLWLRHAVRAGKLISTMYRSYHLCRAMIAVPSRMGAAYPPLLLSLFRGCCFLPYASPL